VEILLVAELDSNELAESVEAQKIATKSLAVGKAQLNNKKLICRILFVLTIFNF
jgi:hypothetical protein